MTWLDAEASELASAGVPSPAILSDMAWTAAVGRSHFDHRAGVVFRDEKSLREGLSALAGAGADRASQRATKVAFVYTGQGSQWIGMGRALYESEPVARAVLDRCEKVIQEVRGASLLDLMFGREGAAGELGDTAWEQPALYALECALTALWSSLGITAKRSHGTQRWRAGGGPGRGSVQPGRRNAVCRGAGHALVRN